ncbi:MAG: DALR domain-containing protein, partial [Oscillospiraceae bacterium]
KYSHYWMHNGYINVDNRKMSKSLGNFFTVRDVAEKFGYEPIKFMMLQSHYRSPINYSYDVIEQCKSALERLHTCYNNMIFNLKNATETASIDETDFKNQLEIRTQQFITAMDDDLNTADGIAAVFDMVRDINSFLTVPRSKNIITFAVEQFKALTDVLGILYEEDKADSDDAEIEALIEKRQQAKKDKNFALSDAIRDELKAKGVEIKDTRQGVQWNRI